MPVGAIFQAKYQTRPVQIVELGLDGQHPLGTRALFPG
jgi:hypothetical protein